MANDNEVFDFMNQADPVIDFTGASAEYYLQKYFDRPEDEGNLKGFQKALSDMGIVNPGADAINSAIFAAQGEWGDAALSAVAVIPVLGEIKKTQKLLKKSGEKMVTLYRGVDYWYPGKMVKDGKFISPGSFVGNKEFNFATGPGSFNTEKFWNIDKNSIWVTGSKKYAKEMSTRRETSGIVLEFNIPESYLMKENKWLQTGKLPLPKHLQKYSIGLINGGLPKEFLKKVHKEF
jgi:hypothetical protein|tara:strand:- start:63 stop:764 length:702 start_codon:yes stop_codon:yes gene_type:complete